MLNPTEAIYGFTAWLTTRESKIEMGASCDCGGLPDLIEKFVKVNNLPTVSDDWPDNLIHPKE